MRLCLDEKRVHNICTDFYITFGKYLLCLGDLIIT
ncbi:unnamed protein product [Arabidopsis halleri]